MQKLIVTYEISGCLSPRAVETEQSALIGALKNGTNTANELLSAEGHTLRLRLIGSEVSE